MKRLICSDRYLLDDACRGEGGRPAKGKIIKAYDSLLVRSYARIRFRIINGDFLDQIDRLLPEQGRILELGCGFGLFSLYFAGRSAQREVVGLELDQDRVDQARRAAKRLSLDNVFFHQGNAIEAITGEKFDAILCLDLLHHLPAEMHAAVLGNIAESLSDNGLFLLKDISTRPRLKLWFNFVLDLLMAGFTPVCYRHHRVWEQMVREAGMSSFLVHLHSYLPYPHFLLVCVRNRSAFLRVLK